MADPTSHARRQAVLNPVEVSLITLTGRCPRPGLVSLNADKMSLSQGPSYCDLYARRVYMTASGGLLCFRLTFARCSSFQHEDSVGNKGTIGPGDVQWMTA